MQEPTRSDSLTTQLRELDSLQETRVREEEELGRRVRDPRVDIVPPARAGLRRKELSRMAVRSSSMS